MSVVKQALECHNVIRRHGIKQAGVKRGMKDRDPNLSLGHQSAGPRVHHWTNGCPSKPYRFHDTVLDLLVCASRRHYKHSSQSMIVLTTTILLLQRESLDGWPSYISGRKQKKLHTRRSALCLYSNSMQVLVLIRRIWTSSRGCVLASASILFQIVSPVVARCALYWTGLALAPSDGKLYWTGT